jgi:hypothetical protein
MSKETIVITGENLERSSSYNGKLFVYKNLNSGIVGSFAEHLMSFYQNKFIIIYDKDE